MTFNNDTASDSQREAFLDGKGASLESDGDDYTLFYKGVDGRNLSLELDAQSYTDALYEACNVLND